MVTRPGRERFAARAISCFGSQSYEPRELVILRHEDESVSLGEMRNRSFARASGDLLATWDDDDLHDRGRLATQIERLSESGADACFLSRITLECLCGHKITSAKRSLWEGTMIVRRETIRDLKYPPDKRGSDSSFIHAALDRGLKTTTVDDSSLYVYRYHGDNLWHAEHFDRLFEHAGSGHRPSSCLTLRSVYLKRID